MLRCLARTATEAFGYIITLVPEFGAFCVCFRLVLVFGFCLGGVKVALIVLFLFFS